MNKINNIVDNLINGNISYSVKKLNRLSKLEFLNFIQEYSLISGLSCDEVIIKLKRKLD